MLRNDISYHRWRAASEARAAEGCADLHVAQIHHRLAALHADRVATLEAHLIDRADHLQRIVASFLAGATRRIADRMG